jgi:peptide/nickel transport system substrate-binding protein
MSVQAVVIGKEGVVKSRRWLWLLGCAFAVVLLAGLVAACESGTTEDTSGVETTVAESNVPRSVLECPQGAQSADTPQYGGSLVLIHDRPPSNIGAFFMKTGFADVQLARYALENLVGLDAQGNPVPQLATSWDVDTAASTITFHLREGVKFHDGTDFDAEAVKWNLDMYRNGEKADLKDIESIDVAATDPYAVVLHMAKIDVNFVQSLSYTCAGKMISPAAYELYGEEGIKLHPVGTGPFEFESYEPSISLKYKAFAGYWQEGLPYLDGVEIKFVTDEVTKFTSYTRGEAQALYGVGIADAADLEAQGHTISVRTMTLWGIAGDMKSAGSPYANLEVRQGISYAINRERAVDGVYEGFNVATDQLAIPDGQAWNPAIAGYPYDAAMATQLLSKNGITPATPWNVDLTYVAGPLENDLWTLIQEDLAAVGVNITLNGTDYAGWMSKATKGAPDELVNFALSYNGIEVQLGNSLTGNLSQDRTWYPDLVLSDAFNAAYDGLDAAKDRDELEVLYEALNKIAIDDDCVVIPVLGVRNRVAKAPDLHDYGFGELTTGEFLPERAWLSEASNPGVTTTAGTGSN